MCALYRLINYEIPYLLKFAYLVYQRAITLAQFKILQVSSTGDIGILQYFIKPGL